MRLCGLHRQHEASETSSTLDGEAADGYASPVKAKDLLRRLHALGCEEIRGRGSHVRVRCGKCSTTVPVHASEDLGAGLLRAIERDLEACLGKGWLRR